MITKIKGGSYMDDLLVNLFLKLTESEQDEILTSLMSLQAPSTVRSSDLPKAS